MDNLMSVSFTIAKDAPAKKRVCPNQNAIKGSDLVLDDKIPLN